MKVLHARLLASFCCLLLILNIVVLSSHRTTASTSGPVPVQVTNTTLSTNDVNLGATQPYATSIGIPFGKGATSAGGTITIPTGKRLVIETVSMDRVGTLAPGESVQTYIDPTVNGVFTAYALPYVPSTTAAYPGTTQTMRLYADSGTTLIINVYRTGSSSDELDWVNISGYLTNAS